MILPLFLNVSMNIIVEVIFHHETKLKWIRIITRLYKYISNLMLDNLPLKKFIELQRKI